MSHTDSPRTEASKVELLTHAIVGFSMERRRLVFGAVAALTLLAMLGFTRISIDTDPENMLASNHPVRELNRELSDTFGSRQQLVAGVSSTSGEPLPDPVIESIVPLAAEVEQLDGVQSVVSLASIPGAEDLSASELRAAAEANPLLADAVVNDSGELAAIFVTIEEKDDALGVSDGLETLIATDELLADLDLEIAGMPLAQETFGEQMFLQMALFAPVAALLVAALIWLFFRRGAAVLIAMAIAMVSVTWTMGLLTGTGNTLHIMSSMIPIFLMPIAILDSVHVLSEFADGHNRGGPRERVRWVFDDLARPLAFTTLTTAVGFGTLAFVPIPPVRVFGIFIALGVLAAWLLTITLLPALIVSADRGDAHVTSEQQYRKGARLPMLAVRHRGITLAAFAVVGLAAIPLAAGLAVNDNPVRWFRSDNPIRTATESLNEQLPGTYPADFVVRAASPDALVASETTSALTELRQVWDQTGVVGKSIAYSDLLGPDEGAEELIAVREQSPLAAALIDEGAETADIRLQLSEGDNATMQEVVTATESHLAANPLPEGVTAEWGGETFLNMAWQDEMVDGMLKGFASTLVLVFALLVILFRSVKWAAIAMSSVLWTIAVVYGGMAVVGKELDMPVVVLSTLVVGIGIDFAIHFVERFRDLSTHLSRRQAIEAFSHEPASALTRNALVIAIGFLPLLFAALVPYIVVGVFLATIIVLSWLATMTALPAMVGTSTTPPAEDPDDVTLERLDVASPA